MAKSFLLPKLFLTGLLSMGVYGQMSVDKSESSLTFKSNINGIVVAKIIGPNGKMLVNKRYKGSSFSWIPSGPDGAYRYDVRVVPTEYSRDEKNKGESDYAGGMFEIHNGQIYIVRRGDGS